MQQHYFVTYVPSPNQIDDRSAIEQWTERMKFIAEDLTWLLQQSHPQFWCEVCTTTRNRCDCRCRMFLSSRSPSTKISTRCSILIYDMHHGSADSSLRRILAECDSRPQRSLATTHSFCVPNGKQLEETVSRLMFMCILRLSTNRESPVGFILSLAILNGMSVCAVGEFLHTRRLRRCYLRSLYLRYSPSV